jgi:hypothetical protein
MRRERRCATAVGFLRLCSVGCDREFLSLAPTCGPRRGPRPSRTLRSSRWACDGTRGNALRVFCLRVPDWKSQSQSDTVAIVGEWNGRTERDNCSRYLCFYHVTTRAAWSMHAGRLHPHRAGAVFRPERFASGVPVWLLAGCGQREGGTRPAQRICAWTWRPGAGIEFSVL